MYEEREAELDRQDSLDALEEERDIAKARSAFYQQQARRYQSREVRAKTYNVGELVLRLSDKKKGQTKAQMGGSPHKQPSPDWWSVPSAKRIGQPTRVEPMERNPPPKILRLAPDLEFVSFLCPFFAYTLSIFFIFLSFILSQGLQGPTCASLSHYRCANRAHYTWGLL